MTDRRDRRAAVLDAAWELFARRGFAETSMADIVAASGVATGTVYRYFENKDAVVLAVSEAVMGVRFAEDTDPLPLSEALDKLMAVAADERHGRMATQVWARSIGSPRLKSLIAARHVHIVAWLARAMEQTSGNPSAAALHRAEITVCAVSGLRERLATGLDIDLPAFRAGLDALAGANS